MQPRKGFLVWLGGLSVLGFLATDMYLPAFAAMQQDLNTSAASISASLSLFLAGFALGQLFWGPLSDRYGRKPVLLSGLAIFAAGCLGMLWVHNATLMLALRFLQAIGVGGVSMLGSTLFSINPFFSILLCFVPRMLDGFLLGYIFRSVSKLNRVAACFVTGFVAAFLNTLFFHVRTHPAFRADRVHAGLDQRPKHSAVCLRIRRRQCRVRDALVHRHHRRRRQRPLKSRVYSNTR